MSARGARYARRHGRRWCGRPRGTQRSAYQRPVMTTAATTTRQKTGPRKTSETEFDIRDRLTTARRAGQWIAAAAMGNHWTVCS